MTKAVKLADIAERVGVSTVTVSKALSGQKGVSEEVRERIKQLADEMGYVKSVSAAKTKDKKSYTLGVIVAERYLEETQSFYWQLYQELSQSAMRKNCFTMLEVINTEDESGRQLPKILEEEKVEAFVVLGTFKRSYVSYVLRNAHVPIVFLDTLAAGEGCNAITSNNLMGAYQVVNYLFEMGHSRIGFVGTRLATASIDDRYLGYIKSCMEHGCSVREDWILDDRDRISGRFIFEKDFQLPEELPSAFFCNCDVAAELLVRKLEERGLHVPQDVSVAGFDDFTNAPYQKMGITTYAINTKEMAKRAVHVLIHKLENPAYAQGVYIVPGKFIERESVRREGPAVPFA